MPNFKAETIASGDVIAPGAAVVIADSGQLPAGIYKIQIDMAAADTAAAGKGLVAQHRDAANAATLRTLAGTPAQCSDFIEFDDYTIANDNERIRVIVMSVAGAVGSEYTATVRALKKF